MLHVEKFARGNWNFKVREKETGTYSHNLQQIIYSHTFDVVFFFYKLASCKAVAFSGRGFFSIIIIQRFYSDNE